MTAESFEQFCRTHEGAVVRSMYLMVGERQEAWDLAQEAFARAFEHWSSLVEMDRPQWWVHKVATNLAITSIRRRNRHESAEPVEDRSIESPLPDIELRRAVLALPAAQRAVIVLRFYLDWSIQDTARALHKRPGTVRALTSQGLATLRRSIPELELED